LLAKLKSNGLAATFSFMASISYNRDTQRATVRILDDDLIPETLCTRIFGHPIFDKELKQIIMVGRTLYNYDAYFRQFIRVKFNCLADIEETDDVTIGDHNGGYWCVCRINFLFYDNAHQVRYCE
jgi:hypothetical protein